MEATIKKSITAYNPAANPTDGWHFIASPLVGSLAPTAVDNLVANPADDYDLYRFDPSAATEWQNYKNPAHTEGFRLENGKGYLYANANGCTLKFTGSTQPYVASANTVSLDDGWNLIGNPYPHNVYASQSYYAINAEKNNLSAEIGSETAIPPCTGIMVQKENALAVTFSKTAPQTNRQGSITIKVGPSDAWVDKAIVSFNEGERLGKYVFNDAQAQLYIRQDGKDYAIVSVGKDVARNVSTMPVNFKAKHNGEYTVTVNPEGVEMSYLHLIDNLTGEDIDLLGSGDCGFSPAITAERRGYTFEAKTTDDESRFMLVFSTNGAGSSTSSETFAYYANGEIVIMADALANASDASLQIVDVMGRILICRDAARHVSTTGMAPGVYVLRLIHSDKVRTQKIIIP